MPASTITKATRPNGNAAAAPAASDYGDAFPASAKVYVEGPHGIRVPMREIRLSGGEPPLRVYDTSGPLGGDVRQGLAPLRAEWIQARGDVDRVAEPVGPWTDLIPQGLVRSRLRAPRRGCRRADLLAGASPRGRDPSRGSR